MQMKIDANLLKLNELNKLFEQNKTAGESSAVSGENSGFEGIAFGSSLFQIEKMGEDYRDKNSQSPSMIQQIKDSLAVLSDTMTAEDYLAMEEQGYDYDNTEVESIVTVVDKIKISLAAHCEDYDMPMPDVDVEQLEKLSGNIDLAYSIANRLKDNNLPVTEENVEDILQTVEMGEGLQPLTDGAVQYLIKNQLAPTISNLYLAEHSSSQHSQMHVAEYFQENGYITKSANEADFQALDEQIEKVIEQAGLSVNESNKQHAQWILSNGIGLTEESMQAVYELEQLTLPLSEEQWIDLSIRALEEGKRPADAALTDARNYIKEGKELLDIINTTDDSDLQNVINKEQEVTFENLQQEHEQGQNSQGSFTQSNAAGTEDIRFITAKRQLEELRLKMTLEASVAMLKKGIEVKTATLEQTIEQLKALENNYYQELMQNSGIEAVEENLQIFEETTEKLSKIPFVPSYVLGDFLTSDKSGEMTINHLHEQGMKLKTALDAASESYETLMTQPRKDMGDSIAKAFRNVDDILDDMNLESTEANKRAIRILGYNSMEITKESVMQVKAADAKVNSMLKNMTPSVTLRMIKEQINPLNLSVDELNEIAEGYQEESLESEEKYSKYLWKLEKNDAIRPEQREAYIGIYRMLYQVEKSDGAVVGALVNQGADMTVKNLLSGVRTWKNKGIDASVDDNFGATEKVIGASDAIDSQIEQAFTKESVSYYETVLKNTMTEAEPEKLYAMMGKKDILGMSLESFSEELATEVSDKQAEWEYAQEQVEELSQLKNMRPEIIRMLTDAGQPVTIQNLFAAAGLMNSKGALFQGLLKKEQQDTKEDVQEEFSEVFDTLADSMDSKEAAQQAYESFGRMAEQSLQEQYEVTADASAMKELCRLHHQLKLTVAMSREEQYQVPVRIGDGFTAVNLKIIRNEDFGGKVTVDMQQEEYGQISASFTVSDDTVQGFVMSENRQGAEFLESRASVFIEELEQAGLKAGEISYRSTSKIPMADALPVSEQTGESTDAKLYKTAKAFLISIRNGVM